MAALANIPKEHKCMTRYEFLLNQQEAGVLDTWFTDFDATARYELWLQIYAYHLANPDVSQLQMEIIFKVGHSTIQRAITFMDKPLTCQPKIWVAHV